MTIFLSGLEKCKACLHGLDGIMGFLDSAYLDVFRRVRQQKLVHYFNLSVHCPDRSKHPGRCAARRCAGELSESDNYVRTSHHPKRACAVMRKITCWALLL